MSFTVYKHTCPNGKVYIGITSQTLNKRWLNGLGYQHNDYFYKAIKKYGWSNIKHETLYTNLSKEDACKIEIELIKNYKSNNRKYGYNICNGGEGVNGYKHSKETIKKIHTLWGKGHIPWNKGKNTPEEVRKKQSKAKIGKPSPRKGTKLSEEHKKKIGLSKKVLVNQYDLQGNFIKTWNSIKECGEKNNINKQNICSCCQGKRKTAGGYIWKYKED